MVPCKEIANQLESLLRAVVQHPNQVVVTEVAGFPMAFEIRVSEEDYEVVISKLHAIKRLAASFVGLPDGQQFTINVIPVSSE